MLTQYFLAYLITGIALFSIGLFVYFANRLSNVNKIFALYSFAISWWSFFSIPAIFTKNSDQAVIWCRIFIVGAIFIPTLFFHFVTAYISKLGRINSKLKNIVIFSYVCSFCFLLLNFTPYFISSAKPKNALYNYSEPGLFFHAHLVYFILITAFGVFLLFEKLDELKNDQNANEQYRPLLYLSWTSFVGYLGGIPNYALVYDFEIPFINPYGTYAVAIYGGLMAYIILRYKFLNIEVIIRRTAVFAGLFTFTYGVFSALSILGQEIFQKYFGWNPSVSIIPTVLIIILVLKPLETFLIESTEKFLFQKKFNYRDLLKTFTNEVLTVLELQKLTEQTVIELSKIIKLESAAMFLHDKGNKVYSLVASTGLKQKNLIFSENDVVVSYLRQINQPILKDKTVDQMAGYSQLKEDFKRLNAQMCVPIISHDEMMGILSLGMKKSGEEFTQEDVDILMTLARTLAIAIANARLFDELSKTQAEAAQREKMAVIGTLAAGINHEICNPLGIVRGQCEMFLLNLRDGLYTQKSKEEMTQIASDIMNKVIKETDRATGITKRLSGFAKPAKKVDVDQVIVEKEVDEVMALIGHDLKLNNIEFVKKFEPDFPMILADKRQIQEVLFNIIRNAAQAMDKSDGKISLLGALKNGMAEIKIMDNGSGIPADKMSQIFNPFFTTKEPGKGTGLGLFIVRQVVERNKGTISVESQQGIGTTFVLTFPAALEPKGIAA